MLHCAANSELSGCDRHWTDYLPETFHGRLSKMVSKSLLQHTLNGAMVKALGSFKALWFVMWKDRQKQYQTKSNYSMTQHSLRYIITTAKPHSHTQDTVPRSGSEEIHACGLDPGWSWPLWSHVIICKARKMQVKCLESLSPSLKVPMKI